MIAVSDLQRHGFLRSHGIDPLTGEACGLGMRVLCDVTEEGKKILERFFGLPEIRMMEAWNPEPGKVGSIMIPRDMFTDLLVMIMVEDGKNIVAHTEDGLYAGTQKEIDDITAMTWVNVHRVHQVSGTGRDKTRNVHEATGREE